MKWMNQIKAEMNEWWYMNSLIIMKMKRWMNCNLTNCMTNERIHEPTMNDWLHSWTRRWTNEWIAELGESMNKFSINWMLLIIAIMPMITTTAAWTMMMGRPQPALRVFIYIYSVSCLERMFVRSSSYFQPPGELLPSSLHGVQALPANLQWTSYRSRKVDTVDTCKCLYIKISWRTWEILYRRWWYRARCKVTSFLSISGFAINVSHPHLLQSVQLRRLQHLSSTASASSSAEASAAAWLLLIYIHR